MVKLTDLKSQAKKPLVATFVGEGGVGKTRLASLFPKPVWIPTENPGQTLQGRPDIPMFPLAESAKEVFEAFQALYEQDHDYKTVVVDSITKMNILFESHVVATDIKKPSSINQANGGYGNGHGAVAEMHRRVRMYAELLMRDKGMNVVFLAHADTKTFNPPDGEPYSYYTIRMNERSIAHYTDDVDLVGFVKLKTYTTGSGDVKKATTDGTREIVCQPSPSHVSKNRLGIVEPVAFDGKENPFNAFV